MMTSGQIAGMMGQQNQMFASSAAYSQQISQQMPGAYGGGMGGGGAAYAPVGGGIPQQGGFSYGGGGGQPTSSRVGGGMVSAMGGAAQFGLGAAGIAAGFGMMGKVGGAMLDPFVGGGAGWRAGGAMGNAMGMGRVGTGAMRLGMGAMGMLPAAGVLMAGSHMIGSTMAGAQEQAQVENVLSRQQMGGASSGGGSFNKQAAKGIGDMMRGMQELPEMMTSMSELTRIMDKMGQMGAMSGTQNVAEFKTKFKQNIKLLKDMSKVMSTSMEEALPMFGEIKRSGFYSTGDILKNAMNRQLTGGISGMNQGQVNQVAQYGAQVNWQQGGTLAQGAQHGLRTASQLGAANKMGLLTDDQITEATGGTGGAAGLQMMSQRLTGLAHKMSKGSLGLATSVALGEKDEEGRFTGKMDAGLMKRYRQGEFSFSDIKRMANQGKQGSAAVQSWATNKSAMRASLASGMGVEGTTQMLQSALGGAGFKSKDHMRLMAQRFGMSERDTNTYLPLMQKMPEIMAEARIRGRADTKRMAREAFQKENYSWDSVKSKAKKRISNVVTEPFKKFGADLRHGINEAVDDFVTELTGEYKVEVTKGMSTLMQGALAGEKTSQLRMAKMMKVSGFMEQGQSGGSFGGDYSRTRLMAGADWASGRDSSGEVGMRIGKAMGLQSYTGSKMGLRSSGVTVLDEDFNLIADDEFTGMKKSDMTMMAKRMRDLGGGESSARQRQIRKVLRGSKTSGRDFMTSLVGISSRNTALGDLEGVEGLEGLNKALGGADTAGLMKRMRAGGVGNASTAEMALAGQSLMGISDSALRKQLRDSGQTLGGLTGGFGTKKENADAIKSLTRSLSGVEGFDQIQAALGKEGGGGNLDILFGTMGGTSGLLGKMEGREDLKLGRLGTYDGSRGALSPDSMGESEKRKATTIHRALKEIAGQDEYSGMRGARDVRTKTYDSGTFREDFGGKVIDRLADKMTLAGMATGHDKKKAMKHFKKNTSKAEFRLFYENKEAVKDVMMQGSLTRALTSMSTGGSPTDHDAKMLEEAGFELSNLSDEEAGEFLELKKVADKMTPTQKAKLSELRKRTWSAGTTQMMEDIRDEGVALQDRVSGALGAAEDVGLTLSEDAKKLMGKVSAAGARMEEGGAGSEEALALVTGGGLGFGEMAAELERLGNVGKGVKGKRGKAMRAQAQREMAFIKKEGGGDQLSFAHSARMRTASALQQAGGGKGGKKDVALDKMFSAEAFAGMEEGQRKQIMDIVGEDKIIGAGAEQEQLKQFMSEKASSKTLTAAGIVTKNAGANPADIAASMQQFVGATGELAAFVKTLATGESAEGKGGKKPGKPSEA